MYKRSRRNEWWYSRCFRSSRDTINGYNCYMLFTRLTKYIESRCRIVSISFVWYRTNEYVRDERQIFFPFFASPFFLFSPVSKRSGKIMITWWLMRETKGWSEYRTIFLQPVVNINDSVDMDFFIQLIICGENFDLIKHVFFHRKDLISISKLNL